MRESLKPGDKITVVSNPLVDGRAGRKPCGGDARRRAQVVGRRRSCAVEEEKQ